jgi:sulfopyruvate decarboxylase subunit alpha
LDAENLAGVLVEGLQASDVSLVAGVPDGLLAPTIARLEALDRPRYVECAREEECVGVAAGAAIIGQRAVVLCQNAGLLNSLGAFATLAERYRLPMVFVVANRGGVGDAKPYDIEKYQAFSRGVPQVGCVHTYEMRLVTPALIGQAFEWAEAAERPLILSIEKGGR